MPETIQDLPGEIWKPVVGFDHNYEISTMGRLFCPARCCRCINQFGGEGRRPIQPLLTYGASGSGGYRLAALKKNGSTVHVRMHVLVCAAFHEKPFPRAVVRHLNDNPSDNRADNLCWGTQKDNFADARKNGRVKVGIALPHSVLSERQVLDARRLYASGHHTQKEVAALVGASEIAIGQAIRGDSWMHVGGATRRQRPGRPIGS